MHDLESELARCDERAEVGTREDALGHDSTDREQNKSSLQKHKLVPVRVVRVAACRNRTVNNWASVYRLTTSDIHTSGKASRGGF